jgi:trans-aconitate methyltransferase
MVSSAIQKGIDAQVMDAQHLTFMEEFDAVFTNATLHWVPNHDLVLQGVYQALKPGGLFVGEFGGHGNVAAIVTALLATLQKHGHSVSDCFRWNYRSPEAFSSQLASNGFSSVHSQLIPRPTPLPTGMRGWLETFANPFFSGMTQEHKAGLIDEVVELLKHSLQDELGQWTADYIRLRFSAVKPA